MYHQNIENKESKSIAHNIYKEKIHFLITYNGWLKVLKIYERDNGWINKIR